MDDDETPQSRCPQCGQWLDDFDGFGILNHKGCYCSHPNSMIENGKWICGICGEEVNGNGYQ